MRFFLVSVMSLVWGLCAVSPIQAQLRIRDHSAAWNAFVEDIYRLHVNQIKNRTYDTETHTGGYARHPNFFDEVIYRDTETERIISEIQWERTKPRNKEMSVQQARRAIHSISVFVYDDEGRVEREYTASYLPEMRNAPMLTRVFFHVYNEGTTAFRAFDASGELIYERCEGDKWSFDIDYDSWDYDGPGDEDPESIQKKPVYKNCFEDLPEQAGVYLKPQ